MQAHNQDFAKAERGDNKPKYFVRKMSNSGDALRKLEPLSQARRYGGISGPCPSRISACDPAN